MSKAGREFMERFLAASPEERQVLLAARRAEESRRDEGVIAGALARQGSSAAEVEEAVVAYRVKRAEGAPGASSTVRVVAAEGGPQSVHREHSDRVAAWRRQQDEAERAKAVEVGVRFAAVHRDPARRSEAELRERLAWLASEDRRREGPVIVPVDLDNLD